jgi:four helix bundle protein
MLEAKLTAKTPIRSHRDLIVWQKAIDLVVSVYRATEGFPKTETYGLTSQIRRAVTSIPANIAEGQGRRLSKEFVYFLANARGSLWELDTHVEAATRLGFFKLRFALRITDANGRSRSNAEWTHAFCGRFSQSPASSI